MSLVRHSNNHTTLLRLPAASANGSPFPLSTNGATRTNFGVSLSFAAGCPFVNAAAYEEGYKLPAESKAIDFHSRSIATPCPLPPRSICSIKPVP